MPAELFEFHVLRWKLPLMHARQLDDIAYEKVVDEEGDYDDFIAACQGVYRGAARTAELTRYLVLLVMFSRTALEPINGRKAKMEALFRWATGEAPTTKGKAGRLGAALRVSHFLFCHGKYMDAYVLHCSFSLNSVIDCPKALLADDRLLTRLLDQLCTARHSTAQVMELARHILQGEERQQHKHKLARTPRVAAGHRLQSIKAVKEDGTYLVELSNRSRCVSLTREVITSTKEGMAMLTAFSSALGAGTGLQSRRPRIEVHTVVEVCGRRAKQHQALLEGNTCRRWYPTAQLLLWKDGKAKVEEYEAAHTPPTMFVFKEQAYYIDQVSKEPLTDPYTLEAGGHRESYNLSSWQSMLSSRHMCSPVLKAPIEFYQTDGLAAFVPQLDQPLKAEVALWLLTREGQAYSAEVDTITAPAPVLRIADSSAAVEGAHAETKDADEHQTHPHEPAWTSAQEETDPSTSRPVEPGGPSRVLDDPPTAAADCSTAALSPHPLSLERPLQDELSCSRAEVEALRAELERVTKQSKLMSVVSASSARIRPQVRSTQPTMDRIALIKQLRCTQKVDPTTNFLNDNVIAHFMEVLNHHNDLLHHQDQHAYCFDPQVVARAETADGYGLRAFDPIAADAARYWLLPRNRPRCHWWLDVYDRFRHVLYRADSATSPHHTDRLSSSLWPESAPEIRNLSVRQQNDGVSCGDYVIQFAIVIASPGWFPDSGTLSRVLPWDRSEMMSQLDAGIWEIQRPQPRLAISQVTTELINARQELQRKRSRVSGVKRTRGQ